MSEIIYCPYCERFGIDIHGGQWDYAIVDLNRHMVKCSKEYIDKIIKEKFGEIIDNIDKQSPAYKRLEEKICDKLAKAIDEIE